ncbi:MAG: cyclic pyranopterin monophosphate synthase MoaC [Fibrobacterales bacterium]
METELSHIDSENNPSMVNVSEKTVTKRIATAETTVTFPEAAFAQLKGDSFTSPKGPIKDTAIIAGTQAVKRTSDLIPFCHPLLIEGIAFEIQFTNTFQVIIQCTVSITGKTGVEMEALTGASVAALTIYDMCKALTHDIIISNTRLISKSGGKSDINLRH